MLSINPAAERILTRTFWGTGGWKQRPYEMPTGDDLTLAVRAGYMFEPIVVGHDELVERTIDAASRATLSAASDAFVASLSTRWRFLRPFLPSLVVAQALPRHTFKLAGSNTDPSRAAIGVCSVCDQFCSPEIAIDRNVLNFERHKWGGVRHLDLSFVWFCVERLLAEGGQPPTDKDWELLASLLASLRNAPPTTTLTQAERLFELPSSNKQERQTLLETLSVISVLENPSHRGFLHHFPTTLERQLPNRHFMDRGYPGEWWTAADGINDSAVAVLFPKLD